MSTLADGASIFVENAAGSMKLEDKGGNIVVRQSPVVVAAENNVVVAKSMDGQNIVAEISVVTDASSRNINVIVDESDNVVASISNAVAMSVSGSVGNDIVVVNNSVEDSIATGDGSDIIRVSGGDSVNVEAGADNDIVIVNGSQHIVDGGAGNDILRIDKKAGNKILVNGGEGNDIITVAAGTGHVLNGGLGNDKYVINNLEANGCYIIDQTNASANDRDTLSLVGYSKDEFMFSRDENNLVMVHSNGGTITVEGWTGNPLANIIFKDEVVGNQVINGILGYDNFVIDNETNKTFNGSDKDDTITINLGSGNVVNAGKGNDIIAVNGGSGHEINGDEGNDTISVTNAQNVQLSGGTGVDTYNIEWKLGHVIVIDNTTNDRTADNINIFGESVSKDSFVYQFIEDTNTLVMTDDIGGSLSIKLSQYNNELGFNIGQLSIGGESVSAEFLMNNTVDENAYIVRIGDNNSVTIDAQELVNIRTVAIKGFATDMANLQTFTDEEGNLVVTNGTKNAVIKNLAMSSLTNIELCDGDGDAYIICSGQTNQYNCNEDGDGADRYILVGNNFDITLAFGQGFDYATLLDAQPLGGAIPSITQDGNNLVMNLYDANAYLGKVTLVDYFADGFGERYANVGFTNGEEGGTIEELRGLDFAIVGFEGNSNVLTLDATSINKDSLMIAGVGVDLADFSSKVESGALVLTNGDKTIRLENIASAQFNYLEVYGSESDAAVVNKAQAYNITNESWDSCFNRYFFTTNGWTLNIDFASDKDIDNSVVMDLSSLINSYGAETVNAVKNGEDLQIEVKNGAENIGNINIAGYFDESKQGLYGTIGLKVNNNEVLKLNQLDNIAETIVIHGNDYVGSKDIVTGYQSNVKLYGGEGFNVTASDFDDVIEINNEGSSVANGHTINAGAGNDTITVNGGSGHEIYSEAGNDTISVYNVNNVILSGGIGNDIYIVNQLNSNQRMIIDQSSAKYDDLDILDLSEFDSADFSVNLNNNNDLQLIFNNGAIISVKDWNENSLSELLFKDKVLSASQVDEAVNETNGEQTITQLEVIKTFMKSLNSSSLTGVVAVDEAVSICSNGQYENLQALVDEFKSNILCFTGTRNSAEQIYFLEKYCGINLWNEDTGSITGLDAGGTVAKTSETIVQEPENISVGDFVYNKTNTVYAEDFSGLINGTSTESEYKEFYSANIDDITIYWDESNWDYLGVDRSVLEQLMGGLTRTWISSALNLIKESYDIDLVNNSSLLTKLENGNRGIQICFECNPNSDVLAYLWSQNYMVEPEGRKGTNEVLVVNTAYYNNVLTDVNGISSSWKAGYLDRTIAHELVHAVMAANIDSFIDLPLIIKEGMAELVHGVDDYRRKEILDITDSLYSDNGTNLENLLSNVLDYNNEGINSSSELYGAGYALLRYLAKQVSDSYDNVKKPVYAIDGSLTINKNGLYDASNAYNGISFTGKGWTANIKGLTDKITLDFSAYKQEGMTTALHVITTEKDCLLMKIVDISKPGQDTTLGTIRLEGYSVQEAVDIYCSVLLNEASVLENISFYQVDDKPMWLNDWGIRNLYINLNGKFDLYDDRNNTEYYGKYENDSYNIIGNNVEITDQGGCDEYIIAGNNFVIKDIGVDKDSYTIDWSCLTDQSSVIYAWVGTLDRNDILTINNVKFDDLYIRYYEDSGTMKMTDSTGKGIRFFNWGSSSILEYVFSDGQKSVKYSYDELYSMMDKLTWDKIITSEGTYNNDDETRFITIDVKKDNWNVVLTHDYQMAFESSASPTINVCINHDKYNSESYGFYREAYRDNDNIILKMKGYERGGEEFTVGTVVLENFEYPGYIGCSFGYDAYGNSLEDGYDLNLPNFLLSGFNHDIWNSEDNAEIKYVGNDVRIRNVGENLRLTLIGNNNSFINDFEYYYDELKDTGNYIELIGDYNTVNSLKGDDKIFVLGNHNSWIDGGCGDDALYVEGSYNMVLGGEGNDIVYIKGNSNSVYGNYGSDTFVVDWVKASEGRVTDEANESDINTVKLVNASTSDVKFCKNDFGELLLINDKGDIMTIANWSAGSINSINLLDQDNSVSYSREAIDTALSNIGNTELSFADVSIANYAVITECTDEDKEQLLKISGNV